MPRAKKTQTPTIKTLETTYVGVDIDAKTQPLESYPDFAVEGGVNPFKKEIEEVTVTTSSPHSPALGDLIIGHNSHVGLPGSEGLFIGSIVKVPNGYRGRLYAEPVTAERIRQGNVPLKSHNSVVRNSRHKVRFTLLHIFEKSRLDAEHEAV